jgi:hypothetical protein
MLNVVFSCPFGLFPESVRKSHPEAQERQYRESVMRWIDGASDREKCRNNRHGTRDNVDVAATGNRGVAAAGNGETGDEDNSSSDNSVSDKGITVSQIFCELLHFEMMVLEKTDF